ncbi:MAG: CotS family spore coat protein [Clostridium sp.]
MSSKKTSENTELLPIETIKSKILSRYNLEYSTVSMVKFKNTDKQRAVYKVINERNTYCLKKVYYDEKDLLYVYSAMEWLYRNGIHLPKLLPTKDRSRFVMHKEMLFILTPWVEGEKCDFDNSEHIKLSIKTLANLHKVSRNFEPIKGSSNKIGLVDYHSSVSKHFYQILENANSASTINDRFSKTFLDNLDYNLELSKLSMDISSKIIPDELTRSLCHGDYVNKNIIINDTDVWIIDFDKCQTDYCSHDISYFLRRLLKRENTNWEKDLTLQVLYEYMEHHELTSSDIRYIISYISFPQKYWKISRDYYKNIKRCNKKSFQTLFEKGLDRTVNQLSFTYDIIDILIKENLI